MDLGAGEHRAAREKFLTFIPKIVELAIDWNLDSWYKVIRNRMKQSVNADHSVSEATASPISLDKSIRFDRLAHL